MLVQVSEPGLSRSRCQPASRLLSREGVALKNQMWAAGAARLMCPMRFLRTRALGIITPHLAQMIPLCLIPLYFPQKHS